MVRFRGPMPAWKPPVRMRDNQTTAKQSRDASLRTITVAYATMAVICALAAVVFAHLPSRLGIPANTAGDAATGFTIISVANLALVYIWQAILARHSMK